MSRTRNWLPLAALLVVVLGCGKQDQPQQEAARRAPGGVAVVDLDAVAKRLGRDLEMQANAEQRMAVLNDELTTLQGALNRQLQDKKQQLGDEPDDEGKIELVSFQKRLEAQLLERRRSAETKLAAFRQKQIEQFREEVRPVLRDVAAERGLSIVIPKNGTLLLSVDPAVEITDAVVARLQASGASKGPPPAAGKKRSAAESPE